MMLVCPNCSARYLLAPAALGDRGREVRCARCDHQWYAEADGEAVPDVISEEDEGVSVGWDDIDDEEAGGEDSRAGIPDPYADDEDDEEESIPQSVRPMPEGSNVPARPEDVRRPDITIQAQMTGFGAALAIFGILVISFFVFKNTIVTTWPASAAIYEMAGTPVEFKGEGLVIESLSANLIKGRDGKDTLVIKGRVINLTGQAIDVPQLVAMMRDTNGEPSESWLIDPPVDEVAAGASFAFTSDYPAVPAAIGSVNLTFLPTLKVSLQ